MIGARHLDEIAGRSLGDLFPAAGQDGIREQSRRALALGSPVAAVDRIKRLGGVSTTGAGSTFSLELPAAGERAGT